MMEEIERHAVKVAYLNEIGAGAWDWSSLTEEERAEWESIVTDRRNGEDSKTHRARVAEFKERLDEKHGH